MNDSWQAILLSAFIGSITSVIFVFYFPYVERCRQNHNELRKSMRLVYDGLTQNKLLISDISAPTIADSTIIPTTFDLSTLVPAFIEVFPHLENTLKGQIRTVIRVIFLANEYAKFASQINSDNIRDVMMEKQNKFVKRAVEPELNQAVTDFTSFWVKFDNQPFIWPPFLWVAKRFPKTSRFFECFSNHS